MAAMQEVKLEDTNDTSKVRKRDKILGAAGAALKNVMEKASSSIAATSQKLRFAAGREDKGDGDLPASRREKYAGWIMERMAGTKKSVGFFLAKMKDGKEKPFAVALKMDKMEVVEIAARQQLKTTFLVEPGNVLNWTFAVKANDVKFHVMIRR